MQQMYIAQWIIISLNWTIAGGSISCKLAFGSGGFIGLSRSDIFGKTLEGSMFFD